MKIFDAILLIGIIALITMGTVFSSAMFSSVYVEGNSTHEAITLQGFMITNSWIYAISAILILAVIVIAFKLLQKAPT